MNRRAFIAMLGGAAVLALRRPRAARAQQGAKDTAMPVVGFLSGTSPGAIPHLVAAFRRGLAETGFVEGENVAVDYRWAEGRYDRLSALAAELVRRPATLIVALGPPPALAAKAATDTIPIVFHSGGDVVKSGLVVSLNRPGGNATGVNLFTQAVEGKKLDLLSKLVPATATFGFLSNSNSPAATEKAQEMQDAARALDRELHVVGAGTTGEIDAAFGTFVQRRVTALVVMADPFFDDSQRAQLVALASRHAISTIYGQREYAVEGGLISYGTNLSETHRQVGNYAGRILKGARPNDLPVLRPTKFELVINLKTARTLNLEVPPTLLALADEVIE
jgi:putative ABC transport system substrate-binding protein